MRIYYVRNLTANAITINDGSTERLSLDGAGSRYESEAVPFHVLDRPDFQRLWQRGVVAVYANAAMTELVQRPATSMFDLVRDKDIATIIAAGGPTTAALSGLGAPSLVYATPARFPAIDNTGATPTQAGLQAAVDATPVGGTLVLRGRYRLSGTVNVPPSKLMTIDAQSAEIIRAGSATPLSCVGAFEQNFAITAIAVEPIVIDGEPITVTRLTMSATPNWLPQDLVKVFSDDEIPGGHFTSVDKRPRVGEFIEVHSVSGTTVYLRGLLRETYTASPRAARLPYGAVRLLGGVLDVTDTVLANKTRGTAFRFEALHSAQVIGTRAHRLVGPGLQFKSCRGYFVSGYDADYGMNDPANLVYGYGIHDSSCEDGVIVGGTQRGLRHPFTDGTSDTSVGATYPGDFGRTYNTKLIGVTSHGCTAAGFDTHHMSEGVQFIGCTAYVSPELDGFLLRGKGHSVIAGKVYGGYSGVSILSQETGVWSTGESRGHHISDLRVEGANRALTVNVRANTNHPNYRVTDPEITVVVDGLVAKGSTRLCNVVNGNVRMRNVEYVSGTHANGSIVQFDNSTLRLENYRIDLSPVLTYDTASQRIFQAADAGTGFGSTFYAHHGSINTSPAYRTKATAPFFASDKTKRWDVRDLCIETPYASASAFDLSFQPIECAFEWFHTPQKAQPLSQRRSGSVTVADAALAATPFAQLQNAPDPQLMLVADVTTATARTLPALPRGHYDGQRLVILLNTAAAALTVPVPAGSVTLSAVGESVSLIWAAQAWHKV